MKSIKMLQSMSPEIIFPFDENDRMDITPIVKDIIRYVQQNPPVPINPTNSKKGFNTYSSPNFLVSPGWYIILSPKIQREPYLLEYSHLYVGESTGDVYGRIARLLGRASGKTADYEEHGGGDKWSILFGQDTTEMFVHFIPLSRYRDRIPFVSKFFSEIIEKDVKEPSSHPSFKPVDYFLKRIESILIQFYETPFNHEHVHMFSLLENRRALNANTSLLVDFLVGE